MCGMGAGRAICRLRFCAVHGMMTLGLCCRRWLLGALQVAGGNWRAWQHPKQLVPRHRLAQPVSTITWDLAQGQVHMPLCLFVVHMPTTLG
jgi:hypothetical protein